MKFGPSEEEKTGVRRNEKTSIKTMQQQIKLTGKRGDSNSTKQNVMLQDSLWIGKSTVLNQLSVVTATPYEARLVAWIMEVYMAEFFCLKKATMDGLFSDDFVDYTTG